MEHRVQDGEEAKQHVNKTAGFSSLCHLGQPPAHGPRPTSLGGKGGLSHVTLQ